MAVKLQGFEQLGTLAIDSVIRWNGMDMRVCGVNCIDMIVVEDEILCRRRAW